MKSHRTISLAYRSLHSISRAAFAVSLAGTLAIMTGCGAAGNGGSFNLNLTPENTTTTLTSSATTVAGGTSVTLTAVVTPAPVSGSVYFYDGTTQIGYQSLSSGTAVLVTSFTTAGTHSISAVNASTIQSNTSTSNIVTITVTSAAPSTPVTASGGANYIYVIQSPSSATGPNQILKFPATGSATPTSTLNLPTGFSAFAVGLDGAYKLYVAGSLSGSPVILIYSPGASGTATPLQTIAKPVGTTPVAMYVTAYGGIYTADKSGVVWIYNGANSSTPTQTITGTLTGLSLSQDIAVDLSGQIYVSTQVISGTSTTGAIQVFSSTASGNEAPLRTITNPNIFYGIATDYSSNLYAVVDNTSTNTASVVKYSATANGAATPINSIAGSATMLDVGGGIKVDSVGNMYVANISISGTSSTFLLEEYGPLASGNETPGLYFTSAAITTTASEPMIAISQ